MDKYHVGQKVRVVGLPGPVYSQFNGTVAFIVSLREPTTRRHRAINAYRLSTTKVVDGETRYLRVEEHELEPVYDGDQPSTWAESAWKPKSLTNQPEKSNGIRRRITQTS